MKVKNSLFRRPNYLQPHDCPSHYVLTTPDSIYVIFLFAKRKIEKYKTWMYIAEVTKFEEYEDPNNTMMYRWVIPPPKFVAKIIESGTVNHSSINHDWRKIEEEEYAKFFLTMEINNGH